jgi:alginate O-acetyltransferase complex protein AlgI
MTVPVILTLALGLLAQYAPRNIRRATETVMSWMPAFATGAIFAAGIALIELLGPSGVAPFIYFQF